MGVAPERVHVIPPGVDVGSCEGGDGAGLRARLGIPADARVVGFLGQIGSHKGIDDVVQAMRRVWMRIPDAFLVIAGSRTPFVPVLQALITRLPTRRRAQRAPRARRAVGAEGRRARRLRRVRLAVRLRVVRADVHRGLGGAPPGHRLPGRRDPDPSYPTERPGCSSPTKVRTSWPGRSSSFWTTRLPARGSRTRVAFSSKNGTPGT